MPESDEFYRKSYERILREFARLEEHDLQLVKLLKLTLSRTLIAVEEAYPSLVPLCHRIRSHARREAEADFPLERLQRDIDQLSESLRTAESAPPEPNHAAAKTESPAYQRTVFVREFLPPLLEGIELIQPLETHRRQLLDGIREYPSDAHPSALIERTVALINEMRQVMEQEKAELAQFLDEIKTTVQQIEDDAFNQGHEAAKHRGKLQCFDKRLDKKVGELQSDIDNATEIDVLKATVRSQIEHLHESVREFHEAEGRRLVEFESQNKRLRGYLTTVIRRAQVQEAKLKQQCGDRNRCHLTALPNAFAFEQHLRTELGRLAPGRPPKSLVYVEIDNLGKIIESQGRETADRILVVMVQVISRKIHYSDFLARIGPARFAIVLAEQGSEAGIDLADRIHKRMKRTKLRRGGQSFTVTVSCGVTELEVGQVSEEAYTRVLEALQKSQTDNSARDQPVATRQR